MTNQQKPVKIIPKENAIFRLDKNGVWHIEGEKFTNPKIINYFHSIIKRDKDGWFLEQEHEHFIEKVYFPYEDTPLFVFHIVRNRELLLCLNTGEKMPLDPEKLFMKDDNLYIRNNEDIIRLSAEAMQTLAEYITDADGQYVIDIVGKKHLIPRVK